MKKKLIRKKKQFGKTTFSRKEDNYIKQNYLTMPVKVIARNIGRSGTGVRGRIDSMGLIIPKAIIEQRKKDSRYSKGLVPFNKGKKQVDYMSIEAIQNSSKTTFKKGNMPHNTANGDGEIRMRVDHRNRSGKGYYFIRLSLGRWYPLHQHLWEEANGKVASGYCLWFKDGNTNNCTLDNLEMISRSENARRNRNKFLQLPEDVAEVVKLTNKLSKKIKSISKNGN